MSIFIDMHMLPQPVITFRRDLIHKEIVGLCHCFDQVIQAMLLALVVRESTFADPVEIRILRILFECMNHSLDVINEWIITH